MSTPSQTLLGRAIREHVKPERVRTIERIAHRHNGKLVPAEEARYFRPSCHSQVK